MIKAVLDTNVLLIALPKTSPYRPIFDALLEGVFQLPVSTSIIQEYTEIIEQKTTSQIASNVAKLLEKLGNVHYTEVHFKWRLIEVDPDDNKFVDCAIAAQANCIVTDDKHFNVLKDIDFPDVTVVTPKQFLKTLQEITDAQKG